jgi:hypothetical protein
MSRIDDHMFVNMHAEIIQHCLLLQVSLKVLLGSIVEMYYHVDNLLEMRIVRNINAPPEHSASLFCCGILGAEGSQSTFLPKSSTCSLRE